MRQATGDRLTTSLIGSNLAVVICTVRVCKPKESHHLLTSWPIFAGKSIEPEEKRGWPVPSAVLAQVGPDCYSSAIGRCPLPPPLSPYKKVSLTSGGNSEG